MAATTDDQERVLKACVQRRLIDQGRVDIDETRQKIRMENRKLRRVVAVLLVVGTAQWLAYLFG